MRKEITAKYWSLGDSGPLLLRSLGNEPEKPTQTSSLIDLCQVNLTPAFHSRSWVLYDFLPPLHPNAEVKCEKLFKYVKLAEKGNSLAIFYIP